mgnify:CR=1 FL=1
MGKSNANLAHVESQGLRLQTLPNLPQYRLSLTHCLVALTLSLTQGLALVLKKTKMKSCEIARFAFFSSGKWKEEVMQPYSHMMESFI